MLLTHRKYSSSAAKRKYEDQDPYSSQKNIYEYVTPTKIKWSKFQQQITELKKKYTELSNKIEPDIDNEKLFFPFNKWEKQKIDSLKHDPQIVASKLKQLENKAELSRVNMELNLREHSRKKMSSQEQKFRTNKISSNTSSPRKKRFTMSNFTIEPTYLEEYKIIQKLNKHHQDKLNNSQSDQEEHEKLYVPPVTEKGILHYDQLKAKPKFLDFLVHKIESSHFKEQKNPEQQQPETPQNKHHRQMKIQYAKLAKVILNKEVKGLSPEKIIESQYPKFFSKNNDIILSDSIKQNNLCQDIVKEQNNISGRNNLLSREGKRKLQEKFNHIVKEIVSTQRHDPNRINKMKSPLPRGRVQKIK